MKMKVTQMMRIPKALIIFSILKEYKLYTLYNTNALRNRMKNSDSAKDILLAIRGRKKERERECLSPPLHLFFIPLPYPFAPLSSILTSERHQKEKCTASPDCDTARNNI